jgi:hypothetical protein
VRIKWAKNIVLFIAAFFLVFYSTHAIAAIYEATLTTPGVI